MVCIGEAMREMIWWFAKNLISGGEEATEVEAGEG